jgi:Asp-tRNA(Asn)/Glu-tRNA(Gln) amidotransferase A subunit family amidase
MDEVLARVDAELQRVTDREPVVGAWEARRAPDEIRAEAAERRPGPLSGFTLGVKDIIDTAQLPTCRGTEIYAGRQPTADAACVVMARAAGAILVGKTVTTELAVLTPARTRNPLNPQRTPGGSSSGSAAAVADGMVRVAFGSQTGGSVIRPATFCGVVGFKPTYQLVPLTGVHPLAPSCDTLGWFARAVADAVAVLEAVAPPEPGESSAVPAGGLRIGVYRSHDWGASGPGTVTAMSRAIEALRSAGADVVEVDPLGEFEGMGHAQATVMFAEAARTLAWERRTGGESLSPGLRRLLDWGDKVTGGEYRAAQRKAAAARVALDARLADEGFDALLTPAVPDEAPGLETTGDPVFCRVWTLLGVPAVTLPAGQGASGLPVGVQLIGARWDDRALLGVAGTVESVLAAGG